jgi:hypothetical protein
VASGLKSSLKMAMAGSADEKLLVNGWDSQHFALVFFTLLLVLQTDDFLPACISTSDLPEAKHISA